MRLSSKSLLSPSLKNVLLGGGIALGVAALFVTGVAPSGSGVDGNTAAEVGSQVITLRELQRVVDNLNQQTGNEEGRREANIQSGLNQLIQERVILEEAVRMGWTASDKEVGQWVRRRPEFQNEETKKFEHAKYKKFMKSGFMSELDFQKQGRDSVTLEKMASLMFLPEVTPTSLLTERSIRDSTEFNLEFALVEPAASIFEEKLASEAKAFADDPANDARLKEAWESSKGEFVRPAQVQALSILVSHKDAQRAEGEAKNRSKDDALKLIKEIQQKIAAGESFANIAASTNDDANAKLAKGDIGWIDTTNIDPATAAAAFQLSKSNKDSDVIDTPFGYRLLRWQDARERIEKTFDDVKLELAKRAVSESVKSKLATEIETQLNKALEEKNTTEVESLIASNKLEWKVVKKPVTARTRFIEDLGSSDPLMTNLFSLKKKGDFVNSVVNFSGRKSIVRLAERKDGTAPDDEKLKTLRNFDQRIAGQTYYSTMQRKLFDIYTKNKEIKRNSQLLR